MKHFLSIWRSSVEQVVYAWYSESDTMINVLWWPGKGGSLMKVLSILIMCTRMLMFTASSSFQSNRYLTQSLHHRQSWQHTSLYISQPLNSSLTLMLHLMFWIYHFGSVQCIDFTAGLAAGLIHQCPAVQKCLTLLVPCLCCCCCCCCCCYWNVML